MTMKTCFNYCDAPVVNTVSGHPVCQECLDHYTGYGKPVRTDVQFSDYVPADAVADLRGF